VERTLIFRNIACLASVPPADFGVEAFEAELGLGKPEDTTVLNTVSIILWEKARLQILPDRTQFGFTDAADGDFVRRAVDAFVLKLQHLLPGEPIGFSAMLRLTLGDEDPDPSAGLVDANAIAAKLGGTEARGGLAAVFNDETSRWWIELSPLPDEPGVWTYDFNRVFPRIAADGESRQQVIQWFSDTEAELIAQFETMVPGVD
jgi:hypothetical protein